MDADMRFEMLRFRAKDGLLLSGLLHKSGKGNKTAIIYIFGMNGDFFTSRRYTELCRASEGSGIDVFMPQHRGMNPVSIFHRASGKSTFIGTALERFTDSVYDIDGDVSALRRRGYRRFILVGHSTGCQKAVYYQYKRKNRSVKGIVLLAPMDDYNIARKELGNRFNAAVRKAKSMVRNGEGNEITPHWISHYSARRVLSFFIQGNAEARIFNYDSSMREFRSIKCPILAVIGSEEPFAVKPVEELMSILESKSTSSDFRQMIVGGAGHSFRKKEKILGKQIIKWAGSLNG